jgi:hypothetical protein
MINGNLSDDGQLVSSGPIYLSSGKAVPIKQVFGTKTRITVMASKPVFLLLWTRANGGTAGLVLLLQLVINRLPEMLNNYLCLRYKNKRSVKKFIACG